MRKHFVAIIIILFTLALGYGLWLYSESLRTGKGFNLLLRQDLVTKQQWLNYLTNRDSDK